MAYLISIQIKDGVMNNPLRYKPTGVPDSSPAPRTINIHNPPKNKPSPIVQQVPTVQPVQMPSRCVGCRWHIPKKLGGEGILCHQTDGECPAHIIKWALRYTLNGHGKPRKSFANDEELLEALRL